jgi:hypothetical protein
MQHKNFEVIFKALFSNIFNSLPTTGLFSLASSQAIVKASVLLFFG